MKIILFLVLAGLSLAQEKKIECPDGKPVPEEKKFCLNGTLQELSGAIKALRKLECEYKGTIDENKENEENYKAALKKFMTTLVCAGCTFKNASGLDIDLEEILLNNEKLIEYGGKVVLRVSEALGLSKFVPELVCKLLGGALGSECLEHILTKNIPGLVDSLNKLFCKKDTDVVTTDQILEFLTKASCFGDDAINHKELLEEMVSEAGESLKPALESLLDTLKEGLVGTELVKGLGCDLTEALSGEIPILGEPTKSVTGPLIGFLTDLWR